MIDDLEADVARLKAKWFGSVRTPLRCLDDEEVAVAAKWLGRSEAERLRRTSGDRLYRLPCVTGHYGYSPAIREDWRTLARDGFWYVEVFRGSQKENVFEGDRAGCMQTINRLTRMGITITRVGSELAPEEMGSRVNPAPQRSRIFAIMDQLKGFRA